VRAAKEKKQKTGAKELPVCQIGGDGKKVPGILRSVHAKRRKNSGRSPKSTVKDPWVWRGREERPGEQKCEEQIKRRGDPGP